jgi:hypothetical protein
MTEQVLTTKNENYIYIGLLILILLLGTALRVANTEKLPLDQLEANLALNARPLPDGDMSISQPFYSVVTRFLFWMFDESNLFARLLPIIAGCVLILLPWFIGDFISDRMKLFLSLGLALDPALMAASKTAGSQMIALTGAWLAILFFMKKKPVMTGLCLAIFFMSGTNFILGGVIIGFTLLWILLRDTESEVVKSLLTSFLWRKTLIAFSVTYAVLSSAFFTNPSGIGASFQDLSSVFQPTPVHQLSIGMGMLLIAFFLYELFPLALGIWKILADRKHPELWQRFSIWMSLIAFLIILLLPSRSALDLIWVSVPLWALAAGQLDKLVEDFKDFQPISFAVGTFFLLMIGFLLFTYVGAVNIEYDQQQLLIRAALIGGSILLLMISFTLVIYTWNVGTARDALLFGIGFHLVVFGFLSQTWHSAYLGVSPESELWRQSASLVDADRLLDTVEDISEMNHGQRINQPMVLLGLDAPALEWLLRDQELIVTNAITSGEAPEMVITDLLEAQFWGAEYTGQDFRSSSNPNWSWLNIREWMHWSIFHEVNLTTDEMAILWVRTDLFPGQSETE